jgi:ParB-like chromosome segregation protein Spo0J
VRTDDLSRHPESQSRAESDPRLVAEYAEAMLEGAEFPPVVIFQDAEGGKYLADGHHRVDAAARAALKDPRRRAEVLAEVRPGNFEDAVRWAMRANCQHGKRMADADYKRSIETAIELGFLHSVHGKDVVPEVVELTKCSVRTAQIHTVAYRMAMIEQRDRMIWAMNREGHSRRAIGKALGVSHRTVSFIIERLSSKLIAAETAQSQGDRPAP